MTSTKPRLTSKVFVKMQASFTPKLRKKVAHCLKSESEEMLASASVQATHRLPSQTEWNQQLINLEKFGNETSKQNITPTRSKKKRKSLGPQQGRRK